MSRKEKKLAPETKSTRPFLLEVPKPVKEMTDAEKEAFVDEILEALERNFN